MYYKAGWGTFITFDVYIYVGMVESHFITVVCIWSSLHEACLAACNGPCGRSTGCTYMYYLLSVEGIQGKKQCRLVVNAIDSWPQKPQVLQTCEYTKAALQNQLSMLHLCCNDNFPLIFGRLSILLDLYVIVVVLIAYSKSTWQCLLQCCEMAVGMNIVQGN